MAAYELSDAEKRDLTQHIQQGKPLPEKYRAEGGAVYRFVYVDQPGFERNPPKKFAGLAASFAEFQKG
ncbi:hypothetical protein [Ferrigenium sp. UT5]|uniref:hypothetical protein n=1 Tax=Ferrigenium sp. UT5 TaxID=3242105 RepID=UPI00354B034C